MFGQQTPESSSGTRNFVLACAQLVYHPGQITEQETSV